MTWQPIETAPKDGTEVLVWDGYGVKIAWWEPYRRTTGGVWFYDGDNYTWPTHWMPLPEEP